MQTGLVSVIIFVQTLWDQLKKRREAEKRVVGERREGRQGSENHCNSSYAGFKQTKEVLLQFHQIPHS